ncbi:MAG TPA: DUF1326 domain-containing protein [Verrucomicrobiae bacterium]|nr:DUF1326 domain-containing protein [Verrucomicrobiae bacterium]
MLTKKMLSVIAGVSCIAVSSAFAEALPSGKLIELHSCEVYAGGCTVSSESEQGGKYRLQVWDLAGGSWQGVDLTGLKVAVLASSAENLADQGARVDSSVVYLPKPATAAQRQALLAWLKSSDTYLASSAIQTRVAPISLAAAGDSVKVRIGQVASLETVSLGQCANRSCGEDLWYDPSVPTTRFTVALNKESQVKEPLLKLKWDDHAKRSVFVAHFGDGAPARNLFVSSYDWCGAGNTLF